MHKKMEKIQNEICLHGALETFSDSFLLSTDFLNILKFHHIIVLGQNVCTYNSCQALEGFRDFLTQFSYELDISFKVFS